MIAVLMGVTGTGKTTVSHALVQLTGWAFAEGDDYHSAANRQKMHDGIPLTDEDREPWLRALHGVLAEWVASGQNGVMTCSALKGSYRDILTGGLPDGSVRFVVLDVPRAILEERLAHRTHHFMNPDLLDSQLATLEIPADALHVEVTSTPEQAAKEIVSGLDSATRAAL